MMDDAHNTKREDPSASSGQAVCPSKKLDVERRAARPERAEGSSPVGLSRAAFEAQIRHTSGPEYWRSLEELAGTPEFQEMLHREFPKGASEWLDSVSRRCASFPHRSYAVRRNQRFRAGP